MIISTTSPTDNYKIDAIVGVLSSEVVIGINMVKEWMSSFTDKLGGRSTTLENSFKNAREVAIHELVEQAEQVGANSLFGVNVEISEISAQGKSMWVVIAMGTAMNISEKR